MSDVLLPLYFTGSAVVALWIVGHAVIARRLTGQWRTLPGYLFMAFAAAVFWPVVLTAIVLSVVLNKLIPDRDNS